MRIQVYPIWWTFILMKKVEKKLLLQNQSINMLYPYEKNVCIVPNNEKNGDYYQNPCLPIWRMNFDSKENGRRKSFSCNAKASKLCFLMRRMCL